MVFDKKKKINTIYRSLDRHFGDLGWWPASTGFEVMVGAVLTQNTAWTNVEKAIKALRKRKVLTTRKMLALPDGELADIIRPAGYYNIKAKRLKALCAFFMNEFGGNISRARAQDAGDLRRKLLSVNGIGPETADSILVYAFGKPVFVVDAYTKRVFSRHNIVSEQASYREVQDVVHGAFEPDLKAMNQYHALIVETAKNFCRKRKPLCDSCPLRGI